MVIKHTNHLESLDDLNYLLEKYNARINCLSTLHGFLSAIACSPSAMMPSTLHSTIFGESVPVWDNTPEAMLFTETSISFMLYTENTLRDTNKHYTPLIYKDNDLEAPPIVDDWVIGFVEGISTTLQSWKMLFDDKKNKELLLPIIRWYNDIHPEAEWSLQKEDQKNEDSKNSLEFIALLEKNVPLIYQFFTPHRKSMEGMVDSQILSTSPKVGRNDQCPCGSGEKYKKCCIDDIVVYH